MKGKSRGSNIEREYSDKQIFKQLQEWYGKENCIYFKEFLYIVHEKDTYYLMKQCIPDIFFTVDAIPLEKISWIEEMNDSITVKIKYDTYSQLICTKKPRIINRLLQWA